MKKVCIVQTAFLGDTVLASPMIESLYLFYNKKVEIHLVVNKNLETIYSSDKRIKSIFPYDKRDKHKKFFNMLKLANKISKLNLDALFIVHRSLRSSLLSLFIKSQIKIGFTESWLNYLFTKRTNRVGNHEIFKNHRLLEKYDKEFSKFKPNLEEGYKLYIKTHKNSIVEKYANKKNIIISPCSNWFTKAWTQEGFKNITKKILQEYPDFKIIFTGTIVDKKIIRNIIKDIDSKNIIDLSGKINIQELIFLISKTSLLIGNDSAPQHIAAGFKIPTISIFGPTTKKLGYFPFNKNATIVENNLSCRPCGKHGHVSCPKEKQSSIEVTIGECMSNITAKQVFKSVKKKL